MRVEIPIRFHFLVADLPNLRKDPREIFLHIVSHGIQLYPELPG
jgi:hypothetical protein